MTLALLPSLLIKRRVLLSRVGIRPDLPCRNFSCCAKIGNVAIDFKKTCFEPKRAPQCYFLQPLDHVIELIACCCQITSAFAQHSKNFIGGSIMYSHQVNGEHIMNRKRQLLEAVSLLSSSRKQNKTGLPGSGPSVGEFRFGLSSSFSPRETSSTETAKFSHALLSSTLQRNLADAMPSFSEMRFKAKFLETPSTLMEESQLSAILKSQEKTSETRISAILRSQEEARASRNREELIRQLAMLPPAGNSRFGSQLCSTLPPSSSPARLLSFSTKGQPLSSFTADFLARGESGNSGLNVWKSAPKCDVAHGKKAAAAESPTLSVKAKPPSTPSKASPENKSGDTVQSLSLSMDEDQNW